MSYKDDKRAIVANDVAVFCRFLSYYFWVYRARAPSKKVTESLGGVQNLELPKPKQMKKL